MKAIFGRGPSLQARLFLAFALAISLMVLDSQLDSFARVRLFLSSAVAPLQYLANLPKEMMEGVSEQLTTRSRLLDENAHLKSQMRTLHTELLLFNNLKKENGRLRALLGSTLQQDVKKMVTEIMSVYSDPFSLQVVIDKGALDGVYEGQPVINERGVVGQVILVAPTTSRVLLIVDINHAIPIRVERNDIRAIADGTGELGLLTLPNIPRSTDIKVGDLLVSSGLGQRFPEGYPVARITHFNYEEGKPYADVRAEPVVELDKIRHLLLLWPAETPDSVQHAKEEVENDAG